MSRGRFAVWPLLLWTAVVVVFLIAPLVVIVLFSFNDRDLTALPFSGPTLRWYGKFFQSGELLGAFTNSVVIAVVTTVVATTIGTLAAIGLARLPGRAAGVVRASVSMPIMTPRLVIGIALLTLFNLGNVDLSLWTVVVGHTVVAIPFVVLVVSARLVGLDPRIEEAAYDLGASRLAVVKDILLPYLKPAIAGAALIAFTISFDEVVITFFTAGAENTLPTTIWAMLRFGITPEINAVSTLTMVLSIAGALGAEALTRRAGTQGRGQPTGLAAPPT